MPQPKVILILCAGNSCRSHMAEGILRAVAGDLFDVRSAGSKPAGYVHPKSIAALKEICIDISAHTEGTDDEVMDEFRRVRDQIKLVFEAFAAGYRKGVGE